MAIQTLSFARLGALAAGAAGAQPAEAFAAFDDARFAGGTPAAERVVTGARFCADMVHETVPTLADGNRIVRRQGSRLCREGEGRRRQEVQRGGSPRIGPVAPAAPQREVEVQVHAPRGRGVVTALPAREIEGLRVHGERTSRSTPAGQPGNERPIQIVCEVGPRPSRC